LTYERVRDLTAANPAEIFDVADKGRVAEGMDADLVLVDPASVEPIEAKALHTAVGWTPFEGFDAIFPEWAMVRGAVVYDAEEGCSPNDGENVRAA
jgi:dihydroorotase